MRRLVVEVPALGFPVPGMESFLEKIKSLEVLVFLKHDRTGFAVISKIELASQESRIEDVLNYLSGAHGLGSEVQVMDRGKTSYTLFMKGKFSGGLHGLGPGPAEGYITTPFEVRDGNLKLTFLGTVLELKGIIKNLDAAGVRYKVIALTDARFSPDSPLSSLTEKQRRVLLAAYNLGYYDKPKRISSLQLATQLGLASSTLVAHRQKAERRLLTTVLERSQR